MTLLATICLALLAQPETAVGPRSGTLVIDGGGQNPAAVRAFVTLAGGPDAEIVLIPTATESEPDTDDLERRSEAFERAFGVSHVTVLHTRDRAEADTEAFVAPLKTARGVWFGGGRQWRLVDSYMGTRTQREIEGVLARGGVVGGSSAGATIQGSYLVRGAREGNHIMMAKGYEEGFGYLRGVAIDQHLLARGRQDDLVEVIEAKPGLLGIGLDEPTAIVVKGDRFLVVGRSVVGIYDGKDHDGKPYYFLLHGRAVRPADAPARDRRFRPADRAAATTAPRPARPSRARALASAAKAEVDEFIRAHADSSWEMARKIWEWAEVGYQEKRSSALLADALEAGGFRVERGVAGIPTAFIATIGSGKPVIGILGEYDALPGLSQQAEPVRHARAGADGRPRLRPPPLRHGLGRRLPGPGRADQGRDAQGHAAVLRLPGGGGRQRQGVHGPRRPVRRLRRRAALAPVERERRRRRLEPGADRRQVPVPRHRARTPPAPPRRAGRPSTPSS